LLAFTLVSAGGGAASAAAFGHADRSHPVKIADAGKHARLVPAKRLREVARPADVVKIRVHRKAAATGSAAPAAAAAAAPQAPFPECPAVGQDTSCGILIQITDSANNILGDPSQGPFDGLDDTLIGFLNSSSSTISSIQLSSDTNLFNFDQDGLCTQSPQPAGCPFGSTGYEGPGTSFSGINSAQSGGVVNFSPGIAPGQTAYFSLEEPLSATTVTAGGPSTAEAGGAPPLSENPTTCSTAAPVNCATGVFWHQFTDFSIPGHGVPLDFSRTYSSSQASVDGPLGFGWTDTYHMSLATGASGDVTVSQEDGSAVTFAANGAGGFTAAPRVLATLTQNADGSFTFIRDRGQTQYNFSPTGQLTSEVDRNGYVTQLSYNASGQLTTVTDPAGRQLTFTYSGSHIATVTDPMGRIWSYSYDGSGNLTKATDPMGRAWSFSYDPTHQLLTMTDPRGGVTTNVYNGSGQVTSQTDPVGGTTTWSYSGDPTSTAGGTTTMTDPNGNVTTYQYASLELTSLTHASGTAKAATTSYTYDPATLGVTSVTDPNSNVTSNTYDTTGNLLTTADPLGNTTSYDYNSFNEVLDKTSPLGETTNYSYDANGNLQSVNDPLGDTTSYDYADTAHPGDVTSITDPNGNVTSYTYDGNGDVASASVSPTSGVTDTTTYAYNADGERTCVASPNATAAGAACPAAGSPPAADTTATTYNADGELISVTDPDGHVTSYAYDGDGNQAKVTDPAGHVTSYIYNGNNQQTKVTRPDGSSLSSTYDSNGNLTTQTDASGNTTKHSYDALNRLVSTANPLGQTTSYGYDADGNRTTLTDPSGRITTYHYDAASELTGITYSDGSTPDVSYTYDADGQRSAMTDGTGTTSYSYDSDGQITSTTNGANSTVSYGYDVAGNLTSLTYPNGNTISRNYDAAGRLSSVTDWLGNTTTFGYDHDGNLTSETYPNGVQAASAYDHADQLAGITDSKGTATLASFHYARDNQGQVTSDTETGTKQGTQAFTYNPLSQLASANATPYAYDAAGNPTSLANATTQSFNAADQVTSAQRSTTATAPATDVVVSANQTSHGKTITSPAFTTKTTNELVLAFISAAGPSTGAQKITAVSGGGLAWTRATRADSKPGTGEVWQAHATSPLTNVKITATLGSTGYDGAITVAAFTGARPITGARAAASGNSTIPAVSLTTTAADSLVWGAGEDPTRALGRTPASGQTLVHQYLDTASHATYWSQKTGTIAASGTKVTLADTTTATDLWNLAAAEITSAAGTRTTYGYDKDGNRTSMTPSSGPATTLAYDQANRLTSDAGVAAYAYNGDGLRMSKTVNGKTTRFAWDQSRSLPLVLTSGATNFIYGPGGQPIEQINATTATYLHADQQGSTRLLTNSAGTVVGTYNYTPYGVPTGHTGTVATALQYDGQYTDAESGYQYLRARYYDPATAQFITVDPATTATGQPYLYGKDDPVNLIDPSGLSAIALCSSGSANAHFVLGGGLSVQVCEWAGSGGWTATTINVGAGGGVGVGAGVGGSVTDQFDFNASSPAELQGFGCSIGGSAKFGGGVEGNIGLCRGLSAEGGATIGTPELSANASGGYTWVLTSSTGYESKTPAWVRAIYNRLPAYLRNPSPTICDPVISGPDGPSSFGLPSGEAYG